MVEDVAWKLVAQWFKFWVIEQKNSNPGITKLALLGFSEKKKKYLALNCVVYSRPLVPTGI